ncbi:hypothetical protein CASFOL_038073 [Castilleja foliolosa]|uniref:Uncharacterized protein n=1 Tax=Castilleja foliolosa TaxID=1961234 RepID=A0ABD3BKF2_9LAMI
MLLTCIELRGLNLTGTLPVEFVNLTYLREIDLTRNYLNGTIPRMFGLLRVVNVSLIGNRLSGRIPDEIGDITTLEELVLEDNYLEGNLSASLGRLRNLRRLPCWLQYFNGTIPETYGNLRNLTDFRIDGSNMSGRIPDFIGNWTRLSRLATYYGVGIDLWSAGCILAELFAGKPIMTGRTEWCSPSEEYWKKSKLPHATMFKPQHSYKRCIKETFKDFPQVVR